MGAAQQMILGDTPEAGGAGYRYWRVYITATNGSANAAISRARLRATPGGAEIGGLTASASSSLFAASNVLNSGVPAASSDTWAANTLTLPQWLLLDAGSSISVAQISLMRQFGVFNSSPLNFQVEASADAVSFTTINTFSTVTSWTEGVYLDFNL